MLDCDGSNSLFLRRLKQVRVPTCLRNSFSEDDFVLAPGMRVASGYGFRLPRALRPFKAQFVESGPTGSDPGETLAAQDHRSAPAGDGKGASAAKTPDRGTNRGAQRAAGSGPQEAREGTGSLGTRKAEDRKPLCELAR